tara:strand:+ start:18148 stop:19035 length:888 start_codon:yes stop_codon:yes gene_type:complete
MTYSQTTFIPDVAFEAYLEDNYPTCDDGINNNNLVLTNGFSDVTNISPGGYAISDLSGIENCVNLNSFTLSDNVWLTEVDLSFVTSVPSFYFDISGVPSNVETIILPSTPLSFLKISNTKITELSLNSSNTLVGLGTVQILLNENLTQIDLSNISINVNSSSPCALYVGSNPVLECLNIANGDCQEWKSVEISLNDLLFEIIVDDPVYSENHINWIWQEKGMWDLNNPGQTNPYNYVTSGNSNSCGSLGISEMENEEKELVEILDLMGRKSKYKPNTILIFIYSDGTSEKVYNAE